MSGCARKERRPSARLLAYLILTPEVLKGIGLNIGGLGLDRVDRGVGANPVHLGVLRLACRACDAAALRSLAGVNQVRGESWLLRYDRGRHGKNVKRVWQT